ncbi:unnamed protein product [Acanthoscelides obtectus]|nr:unnamed protein product [Acanthoscelides obtectus]CAK1639639.1 hypothetical protein AOBTE_LOCUS11288 [Acanthoscelides obtectus]
MPQPSGVHLACTALCCCLVLTSVGSTAPQQSSLGRLRPLDMSADPETVAYLLPRLADKYRPSREWSGVTDPRFYLLTEYDDPAAETNGIADEDAGQDSNSIEVTSLTSKRTGAAAGGNAAATAGAGPATDLAGGSLSIVNSLDVLRNRLLLEIARKKAKEGAHRNRNMLMNLGKRWPMQTARDRVMTRYG